MSKFLKINAVFLGFQHEDLKKFEDAGITGEDLVKKVVSKYDNDIKKYIESIENGITSSEELRERRFLFILIPFKNLTLLREKFIEGMSDE